MISIKKNLNLYLRRAHLYLSLFLLPWFLMYGISSVVFSHTQFFDDIYGGWQNKFTLRFEKDFSYDFPEDGDLRAAAKEVIQMNGLPEKAFGVYQPNKNQVNIFIHDFWSSTRLIYDKNQKRLTAEDAGFRWDHFFTGMHARGGFQQESFLNDLWAVMVDIFCIAMLVWIITGIYMWWKLKSVRLWGSVAISVGIISFGLFMYYL